MLSVLFIGKVVRETEQRTDRKGRVIATAGMDLVDAEGATVLVNLIAFRARAVADLARLQLDDEAAIVGHASLRHWTDGQGRKCTGLNVKVSRVMAMDDAGQDFTSPGHRKRLESASQEALRG